MVATVSLPGGWRPFQIRETLPRSDAWQSRTARRFDTPFASPAAGRAADTLPRMSPEIVIPFIVFGTPVALTFIHKYFKFREKQLEADGASPKLLEAVRREYESKQRDLEARIENLESILIENDGDLERRLTEKPQQAALPSPARTKALPENSAVASDASSPGPARRE